MRPEQLKQFVGLMRGDDWDAVADETEVDEATIFSHADGQIDGGWMIFGPKGQLIEEGEFWQRPGLPLESVTRSYE